MKERINSKPFLPYNILKNLDINKLISGGSSLINEVNNLFYLTNNYLKI